MSTFFRVAPCGDDGFALLQWGEGVQMHSVRMPEAVANRIADDDEDLSAVRKILDVDQWNVETIELVAEAVRKRDPQQPRPVQRALVVVGNIADGFQFVGPFDAFDDAAQYCDREIPLSSTWIATLHAPGSPL